MNLDSSIIMRHFFHARQEMHPAPPDLRLERPSLLPYAEGLWVLFSLDGGAFWACDAPKTDFFRVQLPDHLGRQYFLLFLLALHQRFALMALSEKVAAYWPLDGSMGDEDARERAFGEIRDRFLAFTARGYFTQVMQQEHHHRCYRQWQRTFQVNQLYREVRNEVREIHDYLMLRRTQRLELVGPSGRSSSKGTRITVSVVFDNLVEELTPEAIVAEYVPPTLNEVRAEMA
jgi:hypothetical protein